MTFSRSVYSIVHPLFSVFPFRSSLIVKILISRKILPKPSLSRSFSLSFSTGLPMTHDLSHEGGLRIVFVCSKAKLKVLEALKQY